MEQKERSFESRWGDNELDSGYVMIPGFILKHCAAAGVTPDELAFIVQAMSFKWDVPGSQSRPSIGTLAQRLGKSVDTARRIKNSLIDKGLLNIQPQTADNGFSNAPDILNFGKLVRQCRALENTPPLADLPVPPLADLQDEDLESKSYKPQASEPPKKQEVQAETTFSDDKPAIQPHVALIDAYWSGLPGGQPISEDYPRHVRLASKAVGKITPEQITAFMADLYDPKTEVFTYRQWHHKVIPFEDVIKLIKPWIAEHTPRPVPVYVVPPGWIDGQQDRMMAKYRSPDMQARVLSEIQSRQAERDAQHD
jgi:hypothetical protein